MIWVIGSEGMLGQELCDQLSAGSLPYVASDLDVDVLDEAALSMFAGGHREIRAIVNCSAYTAVDAAEDESDKAFAINAYGVANIARAAKRLQVPLVHISTDYVFSGDVDRALSEDDPCEPVSAYGESKLKGEELAQLECEELVIIRTAWLYGLHGKNFVHTMLRLMEERDVLSVVDDQYGSPTNAADLAATIMTVVRKQALVPGTYHYTGKGRTTWYDFAREIYALGRDRRLLLTDCEINPVTTDEYPTGAQRPHYSILATEKIETVYGCIPKEWQKSLLEFIEKVKENS